jgi:hypothetical protein
MMTIFTSRPLPLSSSQHDVVPHGQRRWEIGFAQHLSKFDLDKATDLGDRNVIRRTFERVLRALKTGGDCRRVRSGRLRTGSIAWRDRQD